MASSKAAYTELESLADCPFYDKKRFLRHIAFIDLGMSSNRPVLMAYNRLFIPKHDWVVANIISCHTYCLHCAFGLICERMYEIPVITFRSEMDNPWINIHTVNGIIQMHGTVENKDIWSIQNLDSINYKCRLLPFSTQISQKPWSEELHSFHSYHYKM